ncbi:hypothetical protein BO94DRAFT_629334 [Aspergillus sclerotioniger CBS 115572]|uniref:Ankyrin repeat protein n=1 Tax=Aspergillus sclerotioniger CBS 115572 TaxID=1450535 RepID=A0A317US39_9EURO|nr:hypothetical protein BO94DRAFT_629334 [Aspergillus sclerotioniger CBS 115572]PWY64784.1 hypothetical protein BO94DRAFT_629334 [Aspergillus sclerotioniger CBS 115572]
MRRQGKYIDEVSQDDNDDKDAATPISEPESSATQTEYTSLGGLSSPAAGASADWADIIIHNEDVATLRRYVDSNKNGFPIAYERSYCHLFDIAAEYGRLRSLRVMVEIYVADPTMDEPVDKCLARIQCSLMDVACRYADREMVLWLLHHDPPLGTLNGEDEMTGGLVSTEKPCPEVVKNAREDMIKILRDAGASMDQPNAAGRTPPQVLEDVEEKRRRREQEEASRRAAGFRGRGLGREGQN